MKGGVKMKKKISIFVALIGLASAIGGGFLLARAKKIKQENKEKREVERLVDLCECNGECFCSLDFDEKVKTPT